MDKEKISVFTRRIASANPSEIISILFDIYKEYEKEAVSALEAGNRQTAYEAIRNCEEVVVHLKAALNFKYEISKELYSLYDFVLRRLAKANYLMDKAPIEEAKIVMNNLAEAFNDVAKADQSKPVMENTQKIVAGMTYGRYDISETIREGSGQRGFFA